MSFGTLETPVGTLGVTAAGGAITSVGWVHATAEQDVDGLVAEALNQLEAYFAGQLRRFDVPFDLGKQTEATRAVLMTLYDTVGYGDSITYGQLAERSGTDVPARGIGAIMGANPVPLIVPCHRVLASDGLGGYSGGAPGEGLVTKRRLLEFEGALPAPLF
ncbi:methylated-DNA--[protein]-cysteine S-methyltransferase [Microbacterium horticulturae]|uniref:Methylated-DNA--protein-cysteine methyltransferase n=1 Tax=Microbacterium horticulturae TaxID=3028316 RepID=A0ABY8BXI0_9MICO|nr:methylated-DNA--[protein]-cysteine S-methyltransferase [Microbacterium sp. KACC 23027]WEG08906.1 methylated-DNA--[protein]-cysteine S-methyltransferase [Microbacterium sp. KACC 23027]